MVYSGKPSKACDECRLRRTKCDAKKPSCSQCVRAERTCKGYRDPGALVFRDESQALILRRRRLRESEEHRLNWNSRNEKKAPVPLETCSPSAWAFAPLLLLTLGTSADDQARCFFFQNYVLGTDSFVEVTLDYLSEIYQSEEIGSALSDSVTALGMVGLANFWKAPSINLNARSKYGSATKILSSELRSLEKAKSDQTLMATMLLGLFETNTCNSKQSMDTWTNHIKGATALLQLRGKEQLRTSVGYNMFLHLRTQILTNCAQRHYLCPQILVELNKELDFEDDRQAAATRLGEIMIKFSDLRTSMSSFQDYSESERLISEACDLDAELDLWVKTYPRRFTYQIVKVAKPSEEIFSDYYHSYSSIGIATTWNHYRSIRTLVNELIVDQLLHLQQEASEYNGVWQDISIFEDLILSSKAMLLQLCNDICASIPYYLNFELGTGSKSPRQLPKAIHGNLLLWPLYCAGCTKLVSDEMQSWVAGRLQWIADVLGIRQAAPLAFTVRHKRDLMSWQREHETVEWLGNTGLIEPFD